MLSGFRAGVARGRATGEPTDDSTSSAGTTSTGSTGTEAPTDETKDQ